MEKKAKTTTHNIPVNSNPTFAPGTRHSGVHPSLATLTRKPTPVGATETLPVPYVAGGVRGQTVFDRQISIIKMELLTIQTEIDADLKEKEQAEGIVKRKYYSIGEKLMRAKDLLLHGQYEDWVKETWGDRLPLSTANAYKRIFEVFEGYPRVVEVFDFQTLQKLKGVNTPEELRQWLKDHAQELDDSYGKTLKKAVTDCCESKTTFDECLKVLQEQLKVGAKKRKGQDLFREADRVKRAGKLSLASLKNKLTELRAFLQKIREKYPLAGDKTFDDEVIELAKSCIAELEKIWATPLTHTAFSNRG